MQTAESTQKRVKKLEELAKTAVLIDLKTRKGSFKSLLEGIIFCFQTTIETSRAFSSCSYVHDEILLGKTGPYWYIKNELMKILSV